MTLADSMAHGLAGGSMIGASASIMLLGAGRIAGVSGLFARVIGVTKACGPDGLAAGFILALPLGAAVAAALAGPVETRFPPMAALLLGGLLVGYGARLGSGCTSGHGVCGLSRFSKRSLVATAVFMSVAAATVATINAMGLAW
ncbi:YeeE/YedE family protein [Methylosinus sp. H3A]|uniref:YeeE/YedE family protein n=1 Tax=Methylosinus sp. H3A TaxID=2785786 RepID=UPI0018C303EC|nr:YeeE/YedE thiosulfate transporter family protein [Methylosinus sp. H3A]MBG0811995.1 YeeE/YedE family protein [Methylosinus sp. H3A]